MLISQQLLSSKSFVRLETRTLKNPSLSWLTISYPWKIPFRRRQQGQEELDAK
jgi:hypothetical protein